MRGLAEAILQQKEAEGRRLWQKGHKLPSNLIEGSKLFSNLPQLRQRREGREKMKEKRRTIVCSLSNPQRTSRHTLPIFTLNHTETCLQTDEKSDEYLIKRKEMIWGKNQTKNAKMQY